VDLANATVLPGFIDVHTHVLVQGDASSEEYDAQLLKQSIRTRDSRGSQRTNCALSRVHCDARPGDEGAMYADVDVKKRWQWRSARARMQVARGLCRRPGCIRCLATRGAEMPTGWSTSTRRRRAQSGARTVMYGADWIKYYSDRREHFEADGRLGSSVNFTDEEAKAIVEEAHRLGKKVAATPSAATA